MKFNQTGLLRCARYSFAPNHFHYCGPDKQSDMFAYVTSGVSDSGLGEILNRFDTLYKYLVLIASQNGIRDPFDPKVVEAYWLGNSLLKQVKVRQFAEHLKESLELKKKTKPQQLDSLLNKTVDGVPHHTFHVLNVFVRTGHLVIGQTLSTMDNCRISWGKVVGYAGSANGKKTLTLIIESTPLVYEKNILRLGKPVKKTVATLLNSVQVGEFVTCHWGFVCEKISSIALKRLANYTRLAIELFNASASKHLLTH